MDTTHFGTFLALTFKDKLYENYEGAKPSIRNEEIQSLIITLREDGWFGFLGGSSEPGESELQTLARECKEEGNVDISDLNLTRVCEHTLHDNFKVILYHAEITKEQAKSIISNSVYAEHFFTETAGLNSVAIIDSEFHRNRFLSCVKSEFSELATLIQSSMLKKWSQSK